MLYAIAHFLRDKIPWIWDLIDVVNSWLFSTRFVGKLGKIEAEILERYDRECGMNIVPMCEVPTEALVAFFAAQPKDSFTFFKPHGFDKKALRKLQRNKSFLAYVLLDESKEPPLNLPLSFCQRVKCRETSEKQPNAPAIAAYCFIRSFFVGKGFRGRMVGVNYRGKGLGTLMNKLMNEIGFGIGLRLFETVNKKNIASYRSAISASNIKILAKMEDEDLYLEILKD